MSLALVLTTLACLFNCPVGPTYRTYRVEYPRISGSERDHRRQNVGSPSGLFDQ
jgi:hypothetical protein